MLKNFPKLVLSVILLLAGCGRKDQLQPERCTSPVEKNFVQACFDAKMMPVPGKPITILIHGTRLMPPVMLACPLIIPQVITPSGFYRARDLGNIYLMRRLGLELYKNDPAAFPLENLYLFGWSGALSFRSREKAGARLYQVLCRMRDDKELDATPITIITHSHGGNVALNLAAAAARMHDSRVLVDRLIITCCPVQEATLEYVKSPIFKRVWSLFSAEDTIQTIDPQGLYPECEGHCKPTFLFSQRLFKPALKLSQIEIRKQTKAPGHIDFCTKYFYRRLPKLLAIFEDAEKFKNISKNADGLPFIDLADL